VTGQIVTPSAPCTSSTACDFNTSNLQQLTNASGGTQTINLSNMQDGASYSVAVGGPATPATTFQFAAPGFTFVYSPPNGPTTPNTPTIYTFVVSGTVAYVSWIAGFQ
jgi:hypothetical protein